MWFQDTYHLIEVQIKLDDYSLIFMVVSFPYFLLNRRIKQDLKDADVVFLTVAILCVVIPSRMRVD